VSVDLGVSDRGPARSASGANAKAVEAPARKDRRGTRYME
jgi:hypothetical protein